MLHILEIGHDQPCAVAATIRSRLCAFDFRPALWVAAASSPLARSDWGVDGKRFKTAQDRAQASQTTRAPRPGPRARRTATRRSTRCWFRCFPEPDGGLGDQTTGVDSSALPRVIETAPNELSALGVPPGICEAVEDLPNLFPGRPPLRTQGHDLCHWTTGDRDRGRFTRLDLPQDLTCVLPQLTHSEHAHRVNVAQVLSSARDEGFPDGQRQRIVRVTMR